MQKGSRVICVDDRFPPDILAYYDNLPLKDLVYVVRDMGVGISVAGEPGEIVVYLEGLDNPSSLKPPYPERGFASWRFREIQPPPEESVSAEHPIHELA